MGDFTLSINKKELFESVFNNFLNQNTEVEAIIVSDVDGFVIAGEKRMNIDLEILSFLTAVINPLIERVREEFSFKQFGTASIDTEEHRLLFVLINEETTLSLVIQSMGSIDVIAPYAYFLAEKTAQILDASETGLIQISIPDFKFGGEVCSDIGRIKNQLYRSKIEQGGVYRFKFIVIGDHEVGKTSIIRRFVEGNFLEKYRATIGLNVLSHGFNAFGNKINIMLWDIGAQKFFKRYRKTYYKGAQAAFIVFDLTNRESFENVTYWHNELKEFIEYKDLPIIIVGNKTDLVEQKVVSHEEGIQLVRDLSKLTEMSESTAMSDYSDLSSIENGSQTKISYIETSAKTGNRIQDAFNLISYHFILRCEEKEESLLKETILDEINSILDTNNELILTFLSQNELWNPTLQILTKIDKLGNPTTIKDKKKEKRFEYDNGLILKSYIYESYKTSDSDGVLCVFDARDRKEIDPAWIEIISNIIKDLKKNKVISVGIRVSNDENWSKLIESFNLEEEAENKLVSLLFFRIKEDNIIDVFEQLSVTLNTIKNLSFSY
ncbi:MAG: GTP-binding protein [Candidatus Lokiarchaeota archaeon]|nr:GTP-binding protein [Candidatus Lokiarchaeota archaeon]